MNCAQLFVITSVSACRRPPLRINCPLRTSRTPVPLLVTVTLPLSNSTTLLQRVEANPTIRFVAETEPPEIVTELLEPSSPTYNTPLCHVPPFTTRTVLLLSVTSPLPMIVLPSTTKPPLLITKPA